HFYQSGSPKVLINIGENGLYHNGPNGTPYGAIAGVTPPSYADTVSALSTLGVSVISILGTTMSTGDAVQLAQDTGAISGSSAPYVFHDESSTLWQDLADAVVHITEAHTYGVQHSLMDDPEDTFDARTLIGSIVPSEVNPECTAGLISSDFSSFENVAGGDTLCYDITSDYSTAPPLPTEPQLFKATVILFATDNTIIAEREIYILIPAVHTAPFTG
ncbi:hypothetical protein KJ865_14875, partial [Myxococcota bacterium]|nr:hypothetical protein [Myxococcota bacterium]